jgi:hypothetical protein
LVTLVAVLGAIGVVPTRSTPSAAAADSAGAGQASLASEVIPDLSRETGVPPAVRDGTQDVAPDGSGNGAGDDIELPADTGWGKRIVFDISDQRVWLVQAGDRVRSTYLVSGSLTDNLRPGSYAVYSRSRWAVGVDDSGTMQYFVRFAHGAHAAIGFHSIPTKDGRLLQTRADLGTPQSHGCIRQALPDAIRLWNFAPVGTKVVVTA